MQGQGHAAVGDLGGSIITGIDGNPLAVLAAQLNIPLHAIDTAGVPLYLEDGRVPHPSVDKKVSCQPRAPTPKCTRVNILAVFLADRTVSAAQLNIPPHSFDAP